MPPILARSIAALVVAALGYAQIGYFLQHEMRRITIQRSIKDRIRKGLPKEKLTPFRMSEREWQALDWVKPKREFRLSDGSMFDVVTVEVIGGEVDALCIADHEETDLFKGLKEHVKGQLEGGDPEHGPTSQVQRLMASLLPPAVHELRNLFASRHHARSTALFHACMIGHASRWSPPPDCKSGSPSTQGSALPGIAPCVLARS